MGDWSWKKFEGFCSNGRYRRTNTAETIGIDTAWAKSFESKLYAGPRIKSNRPGLRVTSVHGTAFSKEYKEVHIEWAVAGADEMRTAARRLIEKGVDLIKLMITGGIYSEHEAVEVNQFTEDKLRTVMAVAKSGTWLVATFGVAADSALIEADGWQKYAKSRAKQAAARQAESLRVYLAAGMRVATGANLNPIGPSPHAEIRLFEEARMMCLEMLQVATSGK